MSEMLKGIIAGMDRGAEVLNDIEVLSKHGVDYSIDVKSRERLIDKYHPKTLNLVVSEIIENTKEAKTFRFVRKDGLLPVFESGQYINIFVEIDGVRTSRPYSLSSSSKQGAYYEITVSRIATGFVSDYFLDKVKLGDEFEAKSPSGTFKHNPVFHKKNMVFLAGGSGITPFMSMSREILEAGLDRNITLIYGSRKLENVIFKEELEEMNKNHPNFNFHIVLSDDENYSGLKGFIDENMISKLVKDLHESTYYICGPEVMNKFVKASLEKLNVSHKMIIREMFGAAQDVKTIPGWPEGFTGQEEFNIKIGDKTIKGLSGETLLTSLEKSGVRVNVCCRSGECSLCRVRLAAGKVFMPEGVLLRHADEKFGYIHSCKAYPLEDIEIIL